MLLAFAAHPEPQPATGLLDGSDVRFYGSGAFVTYEQLDSLRRHKPEAQHMVHKGERWKIAVMHLIIHGE